jgi:hypothetical protein
MNVDGAKQKSLTLKSILRWLHSPIQENVPAKTQYDSLEKILDALRESRFTYNDAARLRIPAVYYLKDDLDSAKAIVSGELLALGQSQGPVASQYRRFAQNLSKRISDGNPVGLK